MHLRRRSKAALLSVSTATAARGSPPPDRAETRPSSGAGSTRANGFTGGTRAPRRSLCAMRPAADAAADGRGQRHPRGRYAAHRLGCPPHVAICCTAVQRQRAFDQDYVSQ